MFGQAGVAVAEGTGEVVAVAEGGVIVTVILGTAVTTFKVSSTT
jgi:hypothetical protein